MSIESTDDTIAEAKGALNEYLRRGRDATPSLPNSPQRAFRAEGGTDTDLVNDDNLGRIVNDARESALRFIDSKSKNARPLRQIDESNTAAVEGQRQALDWLARKGKSRIRK